MIDELNIPNTFYLAQFVRSVHYGSCAFKYYSLFLNSLHMSSIYLQDFTADVYLKLLSCTPFLEFIAERPRLCIFPKYYHFQ